MEILPDQGECFVCGNTNPQSIGVVWWKLPNGRIQTTFAFNIHQQGVPGFVHGDASAAVVDEVMGLAVWHAGFRAVMSISNWIFESQSHLGKKFV